VKAITILVIAAVFSLIVSALVLRRCELVNSDLPQTNQHSQDIGPAGQR
jgi:hypothetical protein